MTLGDYALAMATDNAPTVANPDQADADHDGIGDVVEGVTLAADDVWLNGPAGAATGSLYAVVSNAVSGLALQTVDFVLDTDGDGTNETYTAVTDANGVALRMVQSSRLPGSTMPYTASWDGGVVTAEDSGTATIEDTMPPTLLCPSSVFAVTDFGRCLAGAGAVDLGTPVVEDDSGFFTLGHNAPLDFPVGTSPVIWTASDGSGNSADCTQQVTVALADPGGDDDDDQLTNFEECEMGSDPGNPDSGLGVLGLAREDQDVRVTWRSVGGTTNVVQGGSLVDPNSSSNLSVPMVLIGSGDVITNWVDPNGVTHGPTRFYWIEVTP
jgi:hypothetical protein